MKKQPVQLGLFGAVAFIYIAILNQDLIRHPVPDVAVLGLPALLATHVAVAALSVFGCFIWLRVTGNLGGSVYSAETQKGFWQYATIGIAVILQLSIIFDITALYVQALRAFVFFRTPRLAIGALLALPVWQIARRKTHGVFRMAEVFLYVQLLVFPVLLFNVGQWSTEQVRPMLGVPGTAAIGLVPSTLTLYLGNCALLVVHDTRLLSVFRRAIPLTFGLLIIVYASAVVLISGTLGPSLLSISAFPAMKYLQSSRIPALERFDLLFLFLIANVTVTQMGILGHAVSLGFGALGLGQKVGLFAVVAAVVNAAEVRALPPFVTAMDRLLLILYLLLITTALMIPKRRNKQ